MVVKIKKYILLAWCLFYSLKRGKANKRKENIENILVVQMAKLGDIICTTPVFRAIKKQYPQAKLVVMGNKINKEVLKGTEDVDEYIIFDNFFDILKKVRKGDFDFATIMTPEFITLSLVYLANIPLISTPKIENGFSPWETFEYKILRKFVVTKSHKMEHYAPREYLRLLEPIDIHTKNTMKHLLFSEGAGQKVNNYFEENKIDKGNDLIVGISPSAGNKIKKWPAERFAELADYIYEKYKAKIIIIGGERDKEEVEEMISFLNKDTKIFNTLEKFNIDELKALISKMDIFISVDTGPIYIAEAFEVATIDITGPIDEREQPPISEKNRVVFIKDRKRPELYVMNARAYNRKEALRQTEEITVSMVIKEFDSLYNFLSNK